MAPGTLQPEETTFGVESALLVDDGEDLDRPVKSGSRRLVTGAFLAVSLLVAIVFMRSDPSNVGSTEDLGGITSLATEVCSAPGNNCLETKCCIEGGKEGLQCYGKDKNWGECFDLGNCTPGVHEGEKEGFWDATGTFQKAKWNCTVVGKVSKRACWAYGQSDCKNQDRCQWTTGECMPKCSTLNVPDACWGSGNCMWSGDKCEDGCWLVQGKESCTALTRCQWLINGNSSSCGLACHVHGGEADCPHKDKCTWDGNKCIHDPCSAPGEDCRKTKCCSVSRGGLGMQCVEKMKYWATCMDSFNATAMKDWSGKILGVRAFQKGIPAKVPANPVTHEAGCAWAGEECTNTKMCCNEGYTCNKKDENFAGCVKAMTVSTWSKEPLPLPEGWEGTKIGDWRSEYAIQPTPQDKDMAGTSFYCIMAVVPDSPEMALLWTAQSNNASIFGCNATSVYKAWHTGSASWDTAENTVVNTAVFLNVMELVKQDRLYLSYDWTIKVDADCVFLPERLRSHIWGLRPPPDTPIYLKNNDMAGLGNSGFLGAIEVFSKTAMEIFMDNAQDCGKYLGTNSGEDGFFKGCMDALGVGFVWDRSMFTPNFDTQACTKGQYAAYHPLKYPSHWQRCWDIATGKMCQGVTYDCGGPLDPPISSAGIR